MSLRIVLYSPDRAIVYDGRTPDETGVGGGITARLSLLGALAALGNDVTAYVNCHERIEHAGVRYVPLAEAATIDADVFIAISTGGDLSFAPLRGVDVRARRKIVWVQGVPKPADLDAVGADRFVVASRFLRDVLVERWGVPFEIIFPCYNGLHQERFVEAERHAAPRDPHALAYIGPPDKGLASAIEVLRRLRHRDARFRLDVFGGGRLWGRAQDETPQEPGVRSMGLVGQAALVPRLFEYEYCLAPQAMEEGFGIAVQEARRAGQIVLASRVGAFAELIRDDHDGFLIDAAHTTGESHDRMAEIVLSLAADPARRARVKRRAIASASAFSWSQAARTWTEYSSVRRADLSGPPRSAGSKDPAYVLSDPRILIGGYYGHGNLGDEAILQVTLAELRAQMPSLQVTVASANPIETRAIHRVDAVHERDVPALVSAASRANAVVLGGGGLFQDLFGLDERTMLSSQHWGLTLLGAFPAIAAGRHTPFVLFGVGVGPLDTEEGRRFTKLIFERASLATVRDAESRDLVAGLGVPPDHMKVTADAAFLIEPAPAADAQALLDDAGVPASQAGVISVTLRAWDRNVDAHAWRQAVADALDRVIEAQHVAVLFVPFQSTQEDRLTDDRAVAEHVRGLMRRRDATAIAAADLSAAEVARLFASSRLVLAMRLHGVILASAAGTPVVAIAYDTKVRAIMRQAGREARVLDLDSLTADALGDRIVSALEAVPNRDSTSEVESAARENVSQLVALLRSDVADVPAASPEWTATIEAALVERARESAELQRQAGEAAPEPGATDETRLARPGVRRIVKRTVVTPAKRAIKVGARYLMTGPAYVFDRYKRARIATYGADLAGLRAPGEPGLVSIVLPVYNGAGLVESAIESVLRQTYASFELIVVDDGSTDDTPRIVRDAAIRDARIRVIRQENLKLPAALSRGFRAARGEFLTWTSADNRLKPECLQKLVACLGRHPSWDLVYANLDVIDERGEFWRDSPHYEGYQRPHGSEHVHLPSTTGELNVVANNSIGAAFMYRSRVAALLGDYSRHRFIMEDYDYWMRANALMTVRHADFQEPIYDYRFHSRSLTSRWEEFDMLGHRVRMMVFDDFRRDFFLLPAVWVIDGPATALRSALEARVRAAGHLVHAGDYALTDLPRLSVPIVCVRVTNDPSSESPPRTDLPPAALKVLMTGARVLPGTMDNGWDVCAMLGTNDAPPRLAKDFQGWLAAGDIGTLFQGLDIRAKSDHLARLEAVVEHSEASPATCKASVIICTRASSERLRRTLAAVAAQQTRCSHEVIVVDNSGSDRVRAAGHTSVRVIICPIPGLSAARNAGLAEARGDIVCFLDDDAVPAPDWLEWICRALDEHPETGVVGGHIRLNAPASSSRAVQPAWRKYWSEFLPEYGEYTEVGQWARFPWGANWSARRDLLRAVGGFRTRYGRTGDNYWGGEEMVAASLIQRLGARVAVEPRAAVLHDVDPARFTVSHVLHTMVAGYQVYHRAQNDLYVPKHDRVDALVRRLRAKNVDRHVADGRTRWLDAALRKYAQAGLLMTEIADLRRRMRRPVVGQTFRSAERPRQT